MKNITPKNFYGIRTYNHCCSVLGDYICIAYTFFAIPLLPAFIFFTSILTAVLCRQYILFFLYTDLSWTTIVRPYFFYFFLVLHSTNLIRPIHYKDTDTCWGEYLNRFLPFGNVMSGYHIPYFYFLQAEFRFCTAVRN